MSSRRKRAPPVKVDEETKKKLCWNMHEDLKNDNITSEAGNVPVPNSLAAPLIIEDDITLVEGCSIAVKDRVSSPRNFSGLTEPGEETFCIPSAISIPIILKVLPPCEPGPIWKALIGEYSLCPKEGEEVIIEEPDFSSRDVYSVECSLDSTVLEDLMWHQKRRVVQLYQIHNENSDFLKVGIFLLKSGLGRPEFLSDGSGRIRKSNQLIQNLLKLFYDFIIPDLQEDEKEESDTDLERQNIEELYDYVRRAHQNEAHSLKQDIQHPALIRVLRPYQCGAVNWMLKRENYKSSRTHALRVMLLTAIKEMRVGKGASVNTISMYIRATYRSDLQRNQRPIKKTLEKLITEEVVEQKSNPPDSKHDCRLRRTARKHTSGEKDVLTDAENKDEPLQGDPESIKPVLEEHSYCGQSKDRGSKDITLREGVCEPLDETVVKTNYNQLKDADDTQSHSVLDMTDNKCEPKVKQDESYPDIQESVSHCSTSAPCPASTTAVLPFNTSAYRFECICGELGLVDYKARMQCLNCFLWQHAECVNYKQEDVYQGVKKHGFIQPHSLAEQDVVITTYDVLRTELNYVDIPHSNSEDAAEIALRLSAINRWCVSGTPVQRGLEDLYGLVLFLGVDPYWVKHWWEQLLYHPYRRGNPHLLYSLIARLMWRSTKKDVLDQIQIPPQTEEVHWLHFSPVKGHLYHRQHEVCSKDTLVKLRKISDWNLKLGSLDRRTVNSILYPLLRLRQASCHPQAVWGEFLSIQKRRNAEWSVRRHIACLYELSMAWLGSISSERLHATHNLMELLEAHRPGIPPTLRDDRLKVEAEQLIQHYMAKSNSEVAEAQQALQPVLKNIKELKRKIHSGSPWWLEVIQRAIQCTIDEDLVLRIQNELTSNYKQQTSKLSMADKFCDCRGLHYLLSTQMEDLMKSQKTVKAAVKKLEGPPSGKVIEEATVCHLRPVSHPLNKADEHFTDYESKLFAHTVKGQMVIFEEMIED
ncbi:E3 ubiquitin-protein ligase SHPRH [Acipenser ruthenus]|uniref:E3 ubiquitin-protein ligase SHPRH n=1 Tax=Acipenser ruthenus TaxID=7906 RepID=A0A444UI09_ACIRT|nr:E3 ubiquitin-protein ligase SHPRH [Acipenser ruthenus]